MFTDSHCHLLKEYYDEIEDILFEAKVNNVGRYITSGYDNNSNFETINLVKNSNNIYGTIGIHPNNVSQVKDSWFELIEKNYKSDNIVAIGEIGLDYHYGKETKEQQIFWFEKQLSFAEDHHLPVVIHSRDATEDTINCLKKYQVKGVIHSFGGSLETAEIYIKMGFVLGINGTVTFKNSKLKEVLKKIGTEQIILETDCPYLTPEPYRGKKNYPKHIIDIANFICINNEISLAELSTKTNNNIKQIFDI